MAEYIGVPELFERLRFSRIRSMSWAVISSVTRVPGGVRSPKRVSEKSHLASLLVHLNEQYGTPFDAIPFFVTIIFIGDMARKYNIN